jgi:transcriptional regulator with XRE-family HTH domain
VVASSTLSTAGSRLFSRTKGSLHDEAVHIGRLLRQTREGSALTQEALAAASGVRQTAISAYERERRVPAWKTAERLFAAMGVQMRIELESLDADIDRQIDSYAAMSWPERARKLPYYLLRLDTQFPGVPLVVTGAAAAALHGAPVPVSRIDLLVQDTDAALKALCAPLRELLARLWDPETESWVGSAFYPAVLRELKTSQWMVFLDQIRVTLVKALPEGVTVVVDGAKIPVLPLHEIELTDPEAARLLARLRARAIS